MLDNYLGSLFPSQKFNMAEDFDVEAMLEAPYQKNVSVAIRYLDIYIN